MSVLQMDEEWLERALGLARTGLWRLHPERRESAWSRGTFEIFGLEPRDTPVPVREVLERIHPEDRARVEEAVGQARWKPIDLEYRVVLPDGQVRHVRSRSATWHRAGEPFVFGFVQDISEQRRTERMLLESQERYQSLLARHPDGVFALDLRGRYTEVNPAYERWLGRPREQLIHRDFRESFVFPEDVARATELFERALRGEVLQAVEFPFHTENGACGVVSVTTAPIVLHGQLSGVYVVVREITDWVRVRHQLCESEARYRSLVENLLDAVGVIDGERWLYMNGPGLAMFRARQEGDVVGQPVLDFLPEGDREAWRRRFQALAEGRGRTERVEQTWCRADGGRLYSETVGLPMEYDRRPCVQVLIRDVTDRKRAEEQLLHSEKLNAVGQLAAGIAHEIRNPLTSLKGFVQLLHQKARGRNRRYFEIMQQELNRIQEILDELLTLAKPAAVQWVTEDIRLALQEVVTLMNPQAILHGVVIETEFAEDVPPLRCDVNRLKQVFINVIKNAIEAMRGGGTLTVRTRWQAGWVEVAFIDDGPGMPDDILRRLGEPFLTTKERGTGLGLMLSRRIVDSHGGRLSVHSRLGQGTTVSIRLPLDGTGEPAGGHG
ncbi:MAG: PAS domain S-box protein [Alicyclobacillus sp.]|nr:PAS domain S-box protein [Alicyclobacillus sp.]